MNRKSITFLFVVCYVVRATESLMYREQFIVQFSTEILKINYNPKLVF